MTPDRRKLLLLAHVVTSVGWLGAIVSFIVLAVMGFVDQNDQRVRAAYLAMDVIARYVIVPSSFAALLTGLLQSLSTPWGVFRHYWVVFKLFMNVVGSVVLLLHMRPINLMAAKAADLSFPIASLRAVRIQLIVAAVAAIFMLVVATALSVYKPRGTTRYGSRRVASD